jgi:ribosome-binding protein aMBF1 (putative translation factor)
VPGEGGPRVRCRRWSIEVYHVVRADRSGDLSGVIKGLTQPELAAASKIATTTLRGIERADAALTDTNAANLAGQLGITVEEYRAAYQRARQRPAGTPV